MIRIVALCVLLAVEGLLICPAMGERADLPTVASSGAQGEESPPPGVEMLLPRGQIPAIFEPEFVSAEKADIPDSAWVLGVFLNGEAHAYSLNLLNAHEIVNDYYGDVPAAAVW